MNTQRTKRTVWTWAATGAVCCFAGGIGAALVGSMLTAIAWITGAELHPWLRGSGTALLIITIPLLIFSGYCMDWMERVRNKHATGRSGNGERGRVLH